VCGFATHPTASQIVQPAALAIAEVILARMTLRQFNSVCGELMQIICQQLAPGQPHHAGLGIAEVISAGIACRLDA